MLFSAASLSLLLLLAAATASVAASGQKHFQCQLNDSGCLKNYLQNDVIGRFSKGIPEFSVRPFDPLPFEELSFELAAYSNLQITLNHTGAILYGLADIRVLDVRTQVTSTTLDVEIDVSIPKLFYEGHYSLKGEKLLFPIDWSGKFNMSLGDVTDTWMLGADAVQKDDDVFLNLRSISFSPKVSKFSTYASGLFWKFEKIDDFVLEITNKYWRTFYNEMWKLAEPYVLSTSSGAIQSIFSKTPITVTGHPIKQFSPSLHNNLFAKSFFFVASPDF